MWSYEKKLQYPVNIKNPNPKYAQIIMEQYGGPDGEASAALRYLTQRYGQPYNEVKGMLTDIGTEELAHMEMRHGASADKKPHAGGNQCERLCTVFCKSYKRCVSGGGKRCAVDGDILSVEGRCYNRSARGSGGRAKSARDI